MKPTAFNYAEFEALQAENSALKADLAAAVEDLNLASDCDTCDMRGKKGFLACAPLFTGDDKTCANYKMAWTCKEVAV